MSLLRTKGLQIGQDGTATNNFTLYQPGVPDGTLRIGNGNNGSVTDAITLSSSGNVTLANNLSVSGDLSVTGNLFGNSGIGFYAHGVGTSADQPTTGDTSVLSTLFTDVTTHGAFNHGGHYDTTTGTFTAPKTGLYYVFANVRWQMGDFVQNSYIRTTVALGSTGAGNPWRAGITAIIGNNEAYNSYFSQHPSGILYVEENDTLKLTGGMAGGTAKLHQDESSWGAFFLG